MRYLPRNAKGVFVTTTGLIVGGWLLVLALTYNGESYLAEMKLGDGLYLRLVEVRKSGPFQYAWNPGMARTYLPGPASGPVDFEVSGLVRLDRHSQQRGATLLFRVVDRFGRYTYERGQSLAFGFQDSTGYTHDVRKADYEALGAYAVTRSVLPRRDKDLVVLIQDREDPETPPRELKVANPFYCNDPAEWQAAELPMEKTIDGLTMRLDSVAMEFSEVKLRYNVTSDAADWRTPTVFTCIEDPTGNRHIRLPVYEDVWKVEAKVYRNLNPPHPGLGQAVIDGLMLPGAGHVTKLNREIVIDGVKVRLLSIAGPGYVREHPGDRYHAAPRSQSESLHREPEYVEGKEKLASVIKKKPFAWLEILDDTDAFLFAEMQFKEGMSTCRMDRITFGSRRFLVAETLEKETSGPVSLRLSINRPTVFEFFVVPPGHKKP